MISLKHKFLFIHVAKTGGNSIQSILSDYSEDDIVLSREYHDGVERFEVENKKFQTSKHSTLQHYQSVLDRKTFKSLYKFAAIRNPWDRVVSHYFSPHQKRTEWCRDEFVNLLPKVKTLRDYICCKSTKDSVLQAFNVPARKAGLTRDIDYLIRYEHLQADFHNVCKQIDIPLKTLPHRNSSTKGHYSDYYDDELVKLVADRFHEEIEIGGYRFERV